MKMLEFIPGKTINKRTKTSFCLSNWSWSPSLWHGHIQNLIPFWIAGIIHAQSALFIKSMLTAQTSGVATCLQRFQFC